MAWKEMTRNQKRMYRIHKQEEKINELQKRFDKAIECIKCLVKENEKQRVRINLYKSVINDIKHILNNQMDYREFVDIVNDIEEILERVNK